MNETNKFKDYAGDYIQAVTFGDGDIQVCSSGIPQLTPDQAIEFAKQLIELAEEVKSKQ